MDSAPQRTPHTAPIRSAQGRRHTPYVLRVRVTPRSGRDALAGWRDGVLRCLP